MGMIVPFPQARPSRLKNAEAEETGLRGQILFFLGVRYERHEEGAEGRRRGSGSTRRAVKSKRRRPQ
jgi:hypothetical protein